MAPKTTSPGIALEVPLTAPLPKAAHLAFLDGLRGLAALYVVFYHLSEPGRPVWTQVFTGWTRYGHAAVSIFIVLSGYCLMLPVARSSDGELRGGWQDYLLRRARRILPPYYAALLLSIPIDYLHERNHGLSVDRGTVVSHLFLVHNLSPKWSQALDVPMWSVATEWQIYFFLPALLLPLWRRRGMAVTSIVAFVIGLLPHFLLKPEDNFDWACPWYLGLFSLGMWGAVITDRPARTPGKFVSNQRSWLAASLGLLVLALGLDLFPQAREGPYLFVSDSVAGLCAACFIVGCVKSIHDDDAPPWTLLPVRMLRSQWAQRLGDFSYSLYLTHVLVYFTFGWLVARHVHSPLASLIARYGLVLPVMLLVAYGFYLVFERPLMQPRKIRPR
jgi:peptidoglycan/LPS O-acetylase OafA/YrhL